MNEKYYFINKLETNVIDRLDKETIVIYRDYSLQQINEELVKKIKIYCKKKQIKFYLSNNFKLAVKLDLDGAYIPSFNHNTNHLAFSYKKKFDVIGSAHNLKEIRVKEKQRLVEFLYLLYLKKIKII